MWELLGHRCPLGDCPGRENRKRGEACFGARVGQDHPRACLGPTMPKHEAAAGGTSVIVNLLREQSLTAQGGRQGPHLTTAPEQGSRGREPRALHPLADTAFPATGVLECSQGLSPQQKSRGFDRPGGGQKFSLPCVVWMQTLPEGGACAGLRAV